MFTHVTEHLNNTDSPIKKPTEAISYTTVSKYARQESTHKNLKNFSVSTLDIGVGTQQKQRENPKVVLTEKVTQSLPFYNKNTSSTTVYDQDANC